MLLVHIHSALWQMESIEAGVLLLLLVRQERVLSFCTPSRSGSGGEDRCRDAGRQTLCGRSVTSRVWCVHGVQVPSAHKNTRKLTHRHLRFCTRARVLLLRAMRHESHANDLTIGCACSERSRALWHICDDDDDAVHSCGRRETVFVCTYCPFESVKNLFHSIIFRLSARARVRRFGSCNRNWMARNNRTSDQHTASASNFRI